MIKRCPNMRHHGNERHCLGKPVGLVSRAHRAEAGRPDIFTPSSMHSCVVVRTSPHHTTTPNPPTTPLSPPLPASSQQSTHWKKGAGEYALAVIIHPVKVGAITSHISYRILAEIVPFLCCIRRGVAATGQWHGISTLDDRTTIIAYQLRGTIII